MILLGHSWRDFWDNYRQQLTTVGKPTGTSNPPDWPKGAFQFLPTLAKHQSSTLQKLCLDISSL